MSPKFNCSTNFAGGEDNQSELNFPRTLEWLKMKAFEFKRNGIEKVIIDTWVIKETVIKWKGQISCGSQAAISSSV